MARFPVIEIKRSNRLLIYCRRCNRCLTNSGEPHF